MQAAHNGVIGRSWPKGLIDVCDISGRERLTHGEQ
jgi:hypothetical protein